MNRVRMNVFLKKFLIWFEGLNFQNFFDFGFHCSVKLQDALLK